jgi:Cupin domain
MPHVSRDTADESITMLGFDVRLTNFDGGYTVCFESHSSDQDLGPLFEGLPNSQCQFQRLGYVLSGVVEFRIGDRTETYTAGDAYYVPPGHVPIHHDGTQIVEFSPTELLGETIGVVMANVDRGRGPVQLAAGR